MPQHNVTLRTAASGLGVGPRQLIARLKKIGALNHQRWPASHHINAGRFVTEQRQHYGNPLWNEGKGQTYYVTLVTPAGMRWLREQPEIQQLVEQKRAAA